MKLFRCITDSSSQNTSQDIPNVFISNLNTGTRTRVTHSSYNYVIYNPSKYYHKKNARGKSCLDELYFAATDSIFKYRESAFTVLIMILLHKSYFSPLY